MIKIALVSHTSAFAGAERMLFNLARLLQAEPEFEPVVLLPGVDDPNSHFFAACKEAEIPVVWMGQYSGYATWYLSEENRVRYPEKKKSVLYAAHELEKQLLRLKIDAVLSNTATNLVAALAAAQLDIPLIAWIHGIMDNANLPIQYDAEYRLLCDRTLMALSAQVMCCSDWTTAFYRSQSISPIQTVHNWTPELREETRNSDRDRPREAQRPAVASAGKKAPRRDGEDPLTPRFACLNSFEEHKGIMTLLKAVRELLSQDKCPAFHLDLYGSGSPGFVEQMTNYMENHDLSKHVTIHPRTTDIGAVYEQSVCLLQPSHLESFGMTIIEAMSLKKPVIATKSGGPSEIIADGETGYLVERNDAKAMAEKMRELLEHPETARAMGERGRSRFDEYFSQEAARSRVLPLLKAAVQSYQGLDQYQQLILDMTLHQLAKDAGSAAPILAVRSGPPAVPYDPDSLCFSGILRKSRRYGVSGRTGTLSAVGVLLANLGGPLEDGTLTLRLFQSGKVVAEAALAGTALRMDNWTYFSFPPVNISDKPLTVELCPEGMDGLGVYELRERRKFIYKVFNKLGHPLKGKDVLNVSLLP